MSEHILSIILPFQELLEHLESFKLAHFVWLLLAFILQKLKEYPQIVLVVHILMSQRSFSQVLSYLDHLLVLL